MILDKILKHKEKEVADARDRVPLEMLQEQALTMGPTRGFARALKEKAANGTAIIAEVKKGSPSKGIIRPDFDPVAIARIYEAAGATCLSVLTDKEFFYGELSYLLQISSAVDIPLLRKEFIVDPYQIYEARAAGADAVLLIAAALAEQELKEFTALATELQLDVLLEVHNEEELDVALRVPVELIGINNRDLKSFVTDLGITERLVPSIGSDHLVVSESGINSREDIVRLQQAGAGAFLIGESLMREGDISGKLQQLLQ
ncbi:MAG: indole-3-glycerol phosphate synthase TrpC [Desulfuromonas sp.]|nr:MAG: indole-3-glycerol phosphate synthase TrpC [Desulfuromonas sp.]